MEEDRQDSHQVPLLAEIRTTTKTEREEPGKEKRKEKKRETKKNENGGLGNP